MQSIEIGRTGQEKGEVLQQSVAGVGVVIIDASSGKIWGINELKDKELTGRKRGQLSIPLETRKMNTGSSQQESPYDNLLGALAEAFDDKDMNGVDIRQTLATSLYHVPDGLFTQGFIVPHRGREVVCDIGVVMYDGPQLNVQPYNSLEVTGARWVHPSEFMGNGTRPRARLVMEKVFSAGTYADRVTRYVKNREERVPLLDPTFSIRAMYEKREQYQDMK